MSTLYPFGLCKARSPEKGLAAQKAAINALAADLAMAIYGIIPYLTEVSFKREASAYAGVLAQYLMHVPKKQQAEVAEQILDLAREQLAMDPKARPAVFQLVCDVGFHVALPGGASLGELDKRFQGMRFANGVGDAKMVADDVSEWIARERKWLTWVRDGRPDLSDPRILKESKGPPAGALETIMATFPKTRKDELADLLLDYAADGVKTLRQRIVLWNRRKGRR